MNIWCKYYNFSCTVLDFADELQMNLASYVNFKVWFKHWSGGFLNKYVVINKNLRVNIPLWTYPCPARDEIKHLVVKTYRYNWSMNHTQLLHVLTQNKSIIHSHTCSVTLRCPPSQSNIGKRVRIRGLAIPGTQGIRIQSWKF